MFKFIAQKFHIFLYIVSFCFKKIEPGAYELGSRKTMSHLTGFIYKEGLFCLRKKGTPSDP
jgi:hypothetical protein